MTAILNQRVDTLHRRVTKGAEEIPVRAEVAGESVNKQIGDVPHVLLA